MPEVIFVGDFTIAYTDEGPVFLPLAKLMLRKVQAHA